MNNALTYYRQNEVVENRLYSTQVTEITTEKDDFHSIWPNLAPGKSLINKIGSASGIEFLPTVKMETVYGDIIQNPDGSQVKKPCGLRCTKQGQKMKPDGSMQISSPCTYEFNWEDRAELDYIADEESGKGKYKTALSKRKHFLELKKFASQRASTGAELMVIRELTSMPTAFKEAELKKAGWKMMFSQICKSDAHQKAEAHARIENIRNGGQTAIVANDAAALLTGSDTDVTGDFQEKFERPAGTPTEIHTTPPTTEPAPSVFSTGEGTIEGQPENKSELQKKYESLLEQFPQVKSHYEGIRTTDSRVVENPDGFYSWAIEDIPNSIKKSQETNY